MTHNKLQGKHNIMSLYDIVEEKLNAELVQNGYRPTGASTFKKVVKHYFRHIYRRVIYKFQTVELYEKMGTLTGHKILCTRFNPFKVDVNKTDGYFYFMFWKRPQKYVRWAFKFAPIWKKRQFQNVRDNGGDYPEINDLSYDVYK